MSSVTRRSPNRPYVVSSMPTSISPVSSAVAVADRLGCGRKSAKLRPYVSRSPARQ